MAAPGSSVPYGMFLFNCADEGITGNYDYHARKAVRERIGQQDGRVLASEWLVHHGDILLGLNTVRTNMKNILADDGCNPKKLDPALRTALAKGGDPGYVPYAIGMFGIRFADLEYADERLTCIIHEDAEDEALGGAGLAKMRMVAGFCHAGVRDSSGGHLAP